jgi:hypothetical protein
MKAPEPHQIYSYYTACIIVGKLNFSYPSVLPDGADGLPHGVRCSALLFLTHYLGQPEPNAEDKLDLLMISNVTLLRRPLLPNLIPPGRIEHKISFFAQLGFLEQSSEFYNIKMQHRPGSPTFRGQTIISGAQPPNGGEPRPGSGPGRSSFDIERETLLPNSPATLPKEKPYETIAPEKVDYLMTALLFLPPAMGGLAFGQ